MKKLNTKRILAGFLAAIMLLQDSQELLVYAADFAANVPRYVSFSAPDALEEITDVIEVETEQEALSEEERDALVDVQLDSEAGESETTEAQTTETVTTEVSETTEKVESTESLDVESDATEKVESTESSEIATETTETAETEIIETTETTETTEATEEPFREPELIEKEEIPGEIVDYTAESITYALGEGKYQTIFGSNVGTYVDEEGNVYLEDNTLQEIASFSEDGVSVYDMIPPK